jgi:hypothetical protein
MKPEKQVEDIITKTSKESSFPMGFSPNIVNIMGINEKTRQRGDYLFVGPV